MSAASRFVESKIRQRKVMMFAKCRDAACQLALRTLERYSMTHDIFEVCEIDRRHDCSLIENHFLVICLVSLRCVRESSENHCHCKLQCRVLVSVLKLVWAYVPKPEGRRDLYCDCETLTTWLRLSYGVSSGVVVSPELAERWRHGERGSASL